jgi:uncharacterized protein YwqG
MSDRELVAEIAGRFLPDDIAARWLRLLRPAAALRYARPGALVAAVLGGQPRLPESAEWPVWEGHGPLSFIAAIDCAALAAVPLDIPLPFGVLLFFYFDGQIGGPRAAAAAWDPAGARMLYVRPDQATSVRACPAGIEPYPRVGLAVEPMVTYPTFEHPDLLAAFEVQAEDLDSFVDHPVNGEAFEQALWDRRAGPRHQVGGYAYPVQGPPEYDVADPGLYANGRDTRPLLMAEVARWTLLAQIDSDDRAEMMWGDAGVLYWLTRSRDPAGGGLEKVSFTTHCH